MTTRNLLIDPVTGDCVVTAGQLQLVADGPAIQQAITAALRSFQGEWFLDLASGIPYFQSVLVKNPDPRLLRDVFRDAILAVQGVQRMIAIDFQYTPATRALAVSWRAMTSSGLLVTGQTGALH